MLMSCSEVVVPVRLCRVVVVRRRVGVVLGVGRLSQHCHVVVQGQDHVLGHHGVQQAGCRDEGG